MVVDKHDVGSYTKLNARMAPDRYDGVVAIGNNEDGPEYCCRLSRLISQVQEQVVVTPEVRMVPKQGTEDELKGWLKIMILETSLRIIADCSVNTEVVLR